MIALGCQLHRLSLIGSSESGGHSSLWSRFSVSKTEKRTRLSILHSTLILLSGHNDISFILNSFLSQHSVQQQSTSLAGAIHPQYQCVIDNIKHAHISVSTHNNKRQIFSLLSDNHTFKQLESQGFSLKWRNFIIVRRHAAAQGPWAPVPPPQPPPQKKRKMNADMLAHFNEFMEENSHDCKRLDQRVASFSILVCLWRIRNTTIDSRCYE